MDTSIDFVLMLEGWKRFLRGCFRACFGFPLNLFFAAIAYVMSLGRREEQKHITQRD